MSAAIGEFTAREPGAFEAAVACGVGLLATAGTGGTGAVNVCLLATAGATGTGVLSSFFGIASAGTTAVATVLTTAPLVSAGLTADGRFCSGVATAAGAD